MATPPVRVLCIEDEPEIIELVCFILGRKGFDVIGARGGHEGLQALAELKPELVLLDLMMPDIDGWEVYQRMKADPETRHIPVIVITARSQSADRILALQIAQVEAYIVKPFGPADLLRVVEKVLASTTSP